MPGGDEVPQDRIAALLGAAIDDPGRRPALGQDAAALWWELDDRGLCGADPPLAWELALLGLAAWHTGGPELRRQRADTDELRALRDALRDAAAGARPILPPRSP